MTLKPDSGQVAILDSNLERFRTPCAGTAHIKGISQHFKYLRK